MINTTIETYNEYASKIGDRKSLYKLVAKEFNIKTAIYPGSHIDIAPSMIIPKVTYIDNFKGAIKFFKEIDIIKKYIESNKEYKEPCEIAFIGQDYKESLAIEQVDLIISQYAGFVGQDTKNSLKIGGILLANDSHGDASLAYLDDDYEFIGVINESNKIERRNLEKYFKLAKEKEIDLEEIHKKMKGPKYKVRVENYLFKKVQ